jgi:cytoskeletal protein RodZ
LHQNREKYAGLPTRLPMRYIGWIVPTVAHQLREARQAQNLSIAQVAEVTKIRTDYLQALEEGNYDIFSAQVYLRGFVRSYANVLKLDVAQVLAELDAELKQEGKFTEPSSLSGQQRTGLDWVMLQLSQLDWRKGLVGLAAVLVLSVLISGWSSWRHHRTDDPLKSLPPGLYHSTQGISGETLPLPTPAPRH